MRAVAVVLLALVLVVGATAFHLFDDAHAFHAMAAAAAEEEEAAASGMMSAHQTAPVAPVLGAAPKPILGGSNWAGNYGAIRSSGANPSLLNTNYYTRSSCAAANANPNMPILGGGYGGLRAPILGGANLNTMNLNTMRMMDERAMSGAEEDQYQEEDDEDKKADSDKVDTDCSAICSTLSILDCLAACPHTRLLSKMIKKTQLKQNSQLLSTEDQQANVWWNQIISVLAGTGAGAGNNQQQQQGITFFAPSNKALWLFSKMVKKAFPVPFTSKLAAALLSYHVVTGFTNSSLPMLNLGGAMGAMGAGFSSRDFFYAIGQTPFGAVLLNTMLTCPGFVNLGGNVPQLLSVSKCPKTGMLDVNFGVHDAPLFTAKIRFADIQTRNGIIHVINRVLVIPFSSVTLMEMTGRSSFVTSLASSNLLPFVQSTPSITVLVPPIAHTDAVNKIFADYFSAPSAANSASALSTITGLWRSHIIQGSPAYLHLLASVRMCAVFVFVCARLRESAALLLMHHVHVHVLLTPDLLSLSLSEFLNLLPSLAPARGCFCLPMRFRSLARTHAYVTTARFPGRYLLAICRAPSCAPPATTASPSAWSRTR